MYTSATFHLPRSERGANKRDLREPMSGAEIVDLPMAVIGREVLADSYLDENGVLKNYDGYLEDLYEHEQPNGIDIEIPTKVIAVLVTPEMFIRGVLNGNKPLSPTSRKANYEIRSATGRVRKKLEEARYHDIRDSAETFRVVQCLLEEGKVEEKNILHLSHAATPEDLEKLGEITVDASIKPTIIESDGPQTRLGFAVKNADARISGSITTVNRILSETRVLGGIGRVPTQYIIEAARVGIKLSSGRDNAAPEMLTPPGRVTLGPLAIHEISEF